MPDSTTVPPAATTAILNALNQSPSSSSFSSSSNPPSAAGYKVSIGLVEVSALATLIGAQSAELLVLGNRGAAGLPWAFMSTFGLIYTIRACMSAACTDRGREVLGLRSAGVDGALGMDVLVNPTRPAGYTVDLGVLKGVWMSHREVQEVRSSASPALTPAVPADRSDLAGFKRWAARTKEKEDVYSIYAFDRTTTTLLNTVQTGKPGDSLIIHYFKRVDSPTGKEVAARTRLSWAVFLGTFLKAAEIYMLWRYDAVFIWWVSALPWAHGFIFAVLLHATGLSVDRADFCSRDVVAGELPTPLNPGGAGKLIIGLPGNVRRHLVWTVFWATGAIVSTATLVTIFVNLSSAAQSTQAVYVWVGYQLVWLLFRIAINQLVSLTPSTLREGVITSQFWDFASVELRQRAVAMMFGIARQLVTVHPRGTGTYQEDTVTVAQLQELLHLVDNRLVRGLPKEVMATHTSTKTDLVGVLGDTAYRGLGWLRGNLDSQDLYDCVLAFVRVGGKVYAVPSVRVLAGILQGDVEAKVGRFDPRGTQNNGVDIKWVYWVPVIDVPSSPQQQQQPGHMWFEFRGSKMLLGEARSVGFLGRNELHRLLQGGSLNVSFLTEDDVLRTLEVSRQAAETMLALFTEAELLVK